MLAKNKTRSNQDSAWKDILDAYFKEFMEFFYTEIAKKIDWVAGYEALDKELQAITTESMMGKRFVDKLFKVKSLDGQEEVVLIHIEIQSQKEEEFAQRLFHYYYRIYDNNGQSILTLAILADDHQNWHPKSYQKRVFGFSVLNFDFQACKILDYQNKKEELEKSNNPFAIVVLVHLAFMMTKKDSKARSQMKFQLTRRLYEKGYQRDYVINLIKVIDWVLVIPEYLELEYKSKIHELEGQKNMSYITSFERLGREKGLQEGLQEGRQQGRQQGLQQGRHEGQLSLAKKMLNKGIDLEFIKNITGFSEQELIELD